MMTKLCEGLLFAWAKNFPITHARATCTTELANFVNTPESLKSQVFKHTNSVTSGWRFGVAVTRWSRSTQLLYIEPG